MDNFHSSSKAEMSDETKKKLVEAKVALHSTIGQVVLAMSTVPRYRNQMLSDIAHLVVDPLINDRIAIATAKSSSGLEPPAIALWASVSPEVDLRLSEQVKSGVFPARLKSEDWKSGEIVWLLDVISPSRDLATQVLKSFNKVSGKNSVKIHPVVARQIDRDVLEQFMREQENGNVVSAQANEHLN